MHVNEDYSDTTAAAADNVLHAQMWTFINRYSSVGFIRPLTRATNNYIIQILKITKKIFQQIQF